MWQEKYSYFRTRSERGEKHESDWVKISSTRGVKKDSSTSSLLRRWRNRFYSSSCSASNLTFPSKNMERLLMLFDLYLHLCSFSRLDYWMLSRLYPRTGKASASVKKISDNLVFKLISSFSSYLESPLQFFFSHFWDTHVLFGKAAGDEIKLFWCLFLRKVLRFAVILVFSDRKSVWCSHMETWRGRVEDERCLVAMKRRCRHKRSRIFSKESEEDWRLEELLECFLYETFLGKERSENHFLLYSVSCRLRGLRVNSRENPKKFVQSSPSVMSCSLLEIFSLRICMCICIIILSHAVSMMTRSRRMTNSETERPPWEMSGWRGHDKWLFDSKILGEDDVSPSVDPYALLCLLKMR